MTPEKTRRYRVGRYTFCLAGAILCVTPSLQAQGMVLGGIDGFSEVLVFLQVDSPNMPYSAVLTEEAIERSVHFELAEHRVPFGLSMVSDSVTGAMLFVDVTLGQPVTGVIVYAVSVSARQDGLRDQHGRLAPIGTSIATTSVALGWGPVAGMPGSLLESIRTAVAVLVDAWDQYHR